MQTATIIKIGNSLGVRLKHQLIEELDLQPGDEVKVSVRREPVGFDSKLFIEAVKRSHANGGIPSIPDPAAWQREIRKDRPLPGREW